MALELKTGTYGSYYTSSIDSSQSLSQSQMELNAAYICRYLLDRGWSTNAIAGLLGNMQHESALNPGRWQSEDVGNLSGGYGLVQWTPASKYIDWVGNDTYNTMDNNLARIIYEVANNVQYYATDSYPETFKEFAVSEQDPYYLACAFAWNYERSYTVLYGTEEEKEALRQKRGGSANEWYTFITGELPNIPVTPGKKNKKYKFILFNRKRWF